MDTAHVIVLQIAKATDQLEKVFTDMTGQIMELTRAVDEMTTELGEHFEHNTNAIEGLGGSISAVEDEINKLGRPK